MNTQSEQINELITALSKAQGEIRNANKSSLNPHFRSKYADLSEVWDACREPLSKYNLAIVQTMNKDDQGILSLVTTLAHSSGQWMKSIYPLVCKDPNNPQAWGSSITYARRYTLSSIVGIAPDEDDDGNKASQQKVERQTQPKPNELEDKINKEQSMELNKLLEQCDKTFSEKVWDHIRSQGINSFEEMNQEMFRKMRDASIGHISKKNQISANAHC